MADSDRYLRSAASDRKERYWRLQRKQYAMEQRIMRQRIAAMRQKKREQESSRGDTRSPSERVGRR